MPGMRRGAVAMVDALGFRGIWRRPTLRENPMLVIDKLRSLRDFGARYLQEFGGREQIGSDPTSALSDVNIGLLSDTVVVVLGVRNVDDLADGALGKVKQEIVDELAVHFAADIVARMIGKAASELPTLAYRGVIAFGEYIFEDNFFVGPAIDDAAGAMDVAQGAFVWLAPSAYDALRNGTVPVHLPMLPYDIPLKGGDRFSSYAIAPFAQQASREVVDTAIRQLLETFDVQTLDVRIKQQNTRTFLDEAKRLWEADLEAREEYALRQMDE